MIFRVIDVSCSVRVSATSTTWPLEIASLTSADFGFINFYRSLSISAVAEVFSTRPLLRIQGESQFLGGIFR